MSRRLILLRHGRTAWNAEGRFQGQSDPPLDDVGRAQAWDVAGLIAALRPDLLVSSDARRAVETADAISRATGQPLRTDERLRERSLGCWEGLTREEVSERYADQYARWIAGFEVDRPGGESRGQVAVRAVAALDDLPVVPLTVVVTHSATAMAASAARLGLDQQQRLLAPLANCHWSELRLDELPGARWRLRSHNIGPAGPVIPIPVHIEDQAGEDADYAPDATA